MNVRWTPIEFSLTATRPLSPSDSNLISSWPVRSPLACQTADFIPLAMKSESGTFPYVIDVRPAPPKIFTISLSSKPCLCGTTRWYSSGTGVSMMSMTMRAPDGLRKWVKSRVTWETSSKWWYAKVHCIRRGMFVFSHCQGLSKGYFLRTMIKLNFSLSSSPSSPFNSALIARNRSWSASLSAKRLLNKLTTSWLISTPRIDLAYGARFPDTKPKKTVISFQNLSNY